MTIRKRGRPKGQVVRQTPQWNPKKWKPLYDSILAQAILGVQNKRIAASLGIDPQTVSIILNSPAGQNRLAELQKLKQEAIKNSVELRLAALQDKALERVEKFINSEEIAVNAPVKMFDRSMNVLKGLGAMKQEVVPQPTTPAIGSVTVNTLNVTEHKDVLTQINEGVTKAMEAARLHESAFKRLSAGTS